MKREESRGKNNGCISVCAGSGLSEIFKGIGADEVIEGGQTMNPSTEDILQAIEKVNADHIFIFPNNKNIILAAKQAAKVVQDKKVYVVETKTIPQGITAMLGFMPESEPEENLEEMTQQMKTISSLQVTYAVRDTSIDGVQIHKGDVMALGDQGILSAGEEINTVILEALKAVVTQDSELLSIYYGEDRKEDEAKALSSEIQKAYPSLEVELHLGNQPVYYYIISVE